MTASNHLDLQMQPAEIWLPCNDLPRISTSYKAGNPQSLLMRFSSDSFEGESLPQSSIDEFLTLAAPHLRTLDISVCLEAEDSLPSTPLRSLPSLDVLSRSSSQQLTELSYSCPVGIHGSCHSASLASIRGVTSLRSLTIHSADISPRATDALQQLTQLTSLRLGAHVPVSAISKLPNLQHLAAPMGADDVEMLSSGQVVLWNLAEWGDACFRPSFITSAMMDGLPALTAIRGSHITITRGYLRERAAMLAAADASCTIHISLHMRDGRDGLFFGGLLPEAVVVDMHPECQEEDALWLMKELSAKTVGVRKLQLNYCGSRCCPLKLLHDTIAHYRLPMMHTVQLYGFPTSMLQADALRALGEHSIDIDVVA